MDDKTESQGIEAQGKTSGAKELPSDLFLRSHQESIPKNEPESSDQFGSRLSFLALIEPNIILKQEPSDLSSAQIQLSDEQKGNARYFQSQVLIPALPQIAKLPGSSAEKSSSENNADLNEAIGSRMNAIKEEYSQDNPWGPATRAALKDYLDLMHLRTKNLLHGFESYGKPLPPGSLLEIPSEHGKRISTDEYATRVFNDEYRLGQSDLNRPPNHREYWTMVHQNRWLENSESQLMELREKHQDQVLNDLIRERKLPQDWTIKEENNAKLNRERARALVDLTLDLGNLVEVSSKLKLPVKLPEGSNVTVVNGKMNISLDLPRTLDFDDPINIMKIRRLEEYRTESGKKILSALDELRAVKENPISVIAWNDLHLPAAKSRNGDYKPTLAVFDRQDNLLELADPFKYKPAEGQNAEEVNLLEQRPQVSSDQDGNVRVSMQVRAQRVPWYSQQNLIYENVGKAAKLPERIFKPDDIVAVQDHGKFEFMLARDMKTYVDRKSILHYGEKTLFLGMDLAMIATGTIEIGAAIKGARLLASGADTVSGLGLSTRFSKAALDLTLGATGPLSNAYWNSFESGQIANQTRGMIFLGTAALAPAQTVLQFGNAAKNGAKSLLGWQSSVPNYYEQSSNALKFQEIIKSSGNGVEKTADYSTKLMQFGQIPMGVLLSAEISNQIQEMQNPFRGNLHGDRKLATEKPSILRAQTQPDKMQPESADQLRNRFEQYSKLFQNKLSDKNYARQIDLIFQKANQAIMTSDQEIAERIASQLATELSFNGNEIQDLEKANRGALNSQQINALFQHKDDVDIPKNVRVAFERISASKNQDLISATRLALFSIITHRNDGNGAIGTVDIEPFAAARKSGGLQLISQHRIQVSFNEKSLTKDLLMDLTKYENDGRALAITYSLIESGEFSGKQFRAMLNRITTNADMNLEDRAIASQLSENLMSRMGRPAIDATESKADPTKFRLETTPLNRADRFAAAVQIAKNDSPLLRQKALQTILETREADFSNQMILHLYEQEADPGINRMLDKLRNEPAGDRSEPEAINRDIAQRYPDIAQFTPALQRKWINKFFPLLDRDNLVSELENIFRSEKSSSSLWSSLQKQGDALVAERENQFARLKQQAAGDAEQAFSRWARVVLAAIAGNDKAFVLDSGAILMGQKRQVPFDEFANLNSLAQNQSVPVYYQYKSSNWNVQAEQSLKATLSSGGNGIDLSERLLAKLENQRKADGLAKKTP